MENYDFSRDRFTAEQRKIMNKARSYPESTIYADTRISERLTILAWRENRTKIDELRFLIQERAKALNVIFDE